LGWEVDPKKLFVYLNRSKIIDKRFYYGEDRGQQKSEEFKKEIEGIGYTTIFKEVKWPPVLLEKQPHFKRIVKSLFNVLDNVKNKNSEISNKLYELTKKIERLPKINIGNENGVVNLSSERDLKIIFGLIEELDNDLKKLNIDIGGLQENLKLPVYRRKCDFDVEITRDALNAFNEYETLLLFSGDGDYAALVKDLIEKGKKVILVFGPDCKGREYSDIESSLFFECSVVNLRKILQK